MQCESVLYIRWCVCVCVCVFVCVCVCVFVCVCVCVCVCVYVYVCVCYQDHVMKCSLTVIKCMCLQNAVPILHKNHLFVKCCNDFITAFHKQINQCADFMIEHW